MQSLKLTVFLLITLLAAPMIVLWAAPQGPSTNSGGETTQVYLPAIFSPELNTHQEVVGSIGRFYPNPADPVAGSYITAIEQGNDANMLITRRDGFVESLNLTTGVLTPLFTVENSAISGHHLGLLGLAVSPSNEIFVAYSDINKNAVISKFDFNGNEEVMLTIPPLHRDPSQDGVQTHHVPPIRFYRAQNGSDYLLLFNGDGDMQQLPSVLPQNPCSIWGKILAIPTSARGLKPVGHYHNDPRGLEFEGPYNNPNICDEPQIINLMSGVRHPWGGHVHRDPAGNDVLIFGDVGHAITAWEGELSAENKMPFEEINMIPLNLSNPQPFNGGWPLYEGPQEDPRSTKYGGDINGVAVWPAISLSHEVTPTEFNLYRSITGGAIVNLNGDGYYVFGDYIQNEVYVAPVIVGDGGFASLGPVSLLLSSNQLTDTAIWGDSVVLPVAFLPSPNEGEIYMAFRGIYKIKLEINN